MNVEHIDIFKTKFKKIKKEFKETKFKETKRKNKKITTQKVVGQQTLVDPLTGEVIDTIIVQKNVEQDYNFFKVWLLDLMNVLEIVGTKKIKVINYILDNMNTQDNVFVGTHQKIAKELNISRPIVSQTFKVLREKNIIKKINSGAYMLNPDILVKGKTGKRINLLIKYNKLEKEE